MSIGYLNSNNNNKKKTTKPNREGIREKQSLFFCAADQVVKRHLLSPSRRCTNDYHVLQGTEEEEKKNRKPQLFFPLQASLSLFSFL